jgi:hypothetical protein
MNFEVHNVNTKHDRDGAPYVQVVLNTADPMAMTWGQYKFKKETINLIIKEGPK